MVCPREEESLAPDEVNSLVGNENSPRWGCALGLLPQAAAGCEQDASEVPIGRRGARYSENLPLLQGQGNKVVKRFPPWSSPQEARDSRFCQVRRAGAAPNILYEV